MLTLICIVWGVRKARHRSRPSARAQAAGQDDQVTVCVCVSLSSVAHLWSPGSQASLPPPLAFSVHRAQTPGSEDWLLNYLVFLQLVTPVPAMVPSTVVACLPLSLNSGSLRTGVGSCSALHLQHSARCLLYRLCWVNTSE